MGIKIGNIDASYFKVGGDDCSIYLGTTLLYSGGTTPPTPPILTGCSLIIDNINTYSGSTYNAVFSKSDNKWYMLNNLNQYEEYGVYGSGRTGVTTYEGKLTIDGNYEYQYSGGSWVNVGEVVVTSGIEFSKTMSQSTAYDFVGVSIPTSFKILKSEIDAFGYFSFTFQGQYNQYGYQDSLYFDKYNYSYNGETSIMGTVTEEGNYYVYEMQGLDSFFIEDSQYYESLDFTFNFTGSEIGFRGNTWGGSIMFFDGVTIPTSFKILASQIDEIVQMYGGFSMDIQAMNGDRLDITDSTYGPGTVTNDGTYYIYTPNSPSDFEIYQINLYADSVINMIFEGGGTTVPVTYADKGMPYGKQYNSVSSMSSTTCPAVSVGEYGVVNNDVYKFDEYGEWNAVNASNIKFLGKYTSNNAYVVECNTSTTLSSQDLKYPAERSNVTSIYIGDNCVISIAGYLLSNFENLQSLHLGTSLTSIGSGNFNYCTSLTSVVIPSGVTNIGWGSFMGCDSLQSITVLAEIPPTLGSMTFNYTNNCPIYVPSGSVDTYKAASGWSNYSSRIQAIPT